MLDIFTRATHSIRSDGGLSHHSESERRSVAGTGGEVGWGYLDARRDGKGVRCDSRGRAWSVGTVENRPCAEHFRHVGQIRLVIGIRYGIHDRLRNRGHAARVQYNGKVGGALFQVVDQERHGVRAGGRGSRIVDDRGHGSGEFDGDTRARRGAWYGRSTAGGENVSEGTCTQSREVERVQRQMQRTQKRGGYDASITSDLGRSCPTSTDGVSRRQ